MVYGSNNMFRNKVLVFFPLFALVAGLLWALKTPSSSFDEQAIRNTAKTYDARIIRDNWGVAHIFGKTDPDTSFGLGYSQAEDDWATIEEAIMNARGTNAQYRGTSPSSLGIDSPIQDYLFDLFKVEETAATKIDTEVSPRARAMAKAYTDGLNLWAIENPSRVSSGMLPLTDKDIIAGFTWGTPIFYGFGESLAIVNEAGKGEDEVKESATNLFYKPRIGFGSNGFAVAPSRSTDGHTRLVGNSHQPFVGPLAWYEAHVVSEEGLNLVGGGFPGVPILSQGVTPNHAWTHTVNMPDLVDIYRLETDGLKNPRKYKLDGEWKDFEISYSEFRIKIAGPFSFPAKTKMLWSDHGPVIATDNGVFALRFSGLQEVRALDQWYSMSKATNLAEWKAAIAENGVLSFNIVYADKEGNIGEIFNAKMPKRKEGVDWGEILPGDRSDLIWQDYVSVDELPQIYNPESGWLFSANSSPFFITEDSDNLRREDFSETFGIETRMTNRAMQALEIFTKDEAISLEELLAYRDDGDYNPDSIIMNMVDDIAGLTFEDETLKKGQALLRRWNGSTEMDDRATGLAVLTAMHMGSYQFIEDNMALEPAFKKAVEQMESVYGRIDPKWSEVNRLRRGEVDLPLRGGPDTLRAIYGHYENFEENKGLTAVAGDTHIFIADWDENGKLSLQTIHQFGAATLDETSEHYADQAPLFARGEYKIMPMTLEEVLPLAKRDYKPGQ